MKTFTLITALTLCSFSWISVSGSEFQTVEAQPGEEVTLTCSNFSSSKTQIIWFRVVKRSQPRLISFMYEPFNSKLSDEFQNRKFEMSSNISTVFLKIKHVNSSDSGLYFCGFYITGNPIIHDATYLEVQEEWDGVTKLMSMILGGLTVFLVAVIIGLAVKVRMLQTAASEDQNSQQYENVELNYAAVTFQQRAERRQPEPNVIYAATR